MLARSLARVRSLTHARANSGPPQDANVCWPGFQVRTEAYLSQGSHTWGLSPSFAASLSQILDLLEGPVQRR